MTEEIVPDIDIATLCKASEDPSFVEFAEQRLEDQTVWGQAVVFGSIHRLLAKSHKTTELRAQTLDHYKSMELVYIKALSEIIQKAIVDLYQEVANAVVLVDKQKLNWAALFDLREEIACIHEIIKANGIFLHFTYKFDEWCLETFKKHKIDISNKSTPILDLSKRHNDNWWLKAGVPTDESN